MTDPFTTIDGLSDKRRLPRLGKIHLGIKVKHAKTGNMFPKAVDYFVFEPNAIGDSCRKVYGDKPREIDVVIPVADIKQVFPQAYKYYKSGAGKWCWGNGLEAQRMGDDGKYQKMDCLGAGNKDQGIDPCPEYGPKKCSRKANLLIMLPRVAADGVFQIDTGSINNIIDINSGIEGIIKMSEEYQKPIKFFPCLLRRVTRNTTVEGKRTNIYTLILTLANHDRIIELRSEMDKIHRVLSGGEPLALPPVEQAKYEEKDIIPRDVWEGEESEDAEIVEPDSDILDPLKFPPSGISNDLIPAWDNIISMAHKKGVNSWDKLAVKESDRSGDSIQSLNFEDMDKDRLKDIWRMLDGMEGK